MQSKAARAFDGDTIAPFIIQIKTKLSFLVLSHLDESNSPEAVSKKNKKQKRQATVGKRCELYPNFDKIGQQIIQTETTVGLRLDEICSYECMLTRRLVQICTSYSQGKIIRLSNTRYICRPT